MKLYNIWSSKNLYVIYIVHNCQGPGWLNELGSWIT